MFDGAQGDASRRIHLWWRLLLMQANLYPSLCEEERWQHISVGQSSIGRGYVVCLIVGQFFVNVLGKVSCPDAWSDPEDRVGGKQQRSHVKAIKEHKKRVHKRVTELYVKDKKKPRVEDQMSSEAIARQIQKDYDGHGPSARYIRRYVNDYGLFGLSPIGTGTKGTISRWEFNPLCLGLETYIWINKINVIGGDLTRRKLTAIVDKTMGKDPTTKLLYNILNHILRVTYIDLKAGRCDSVEERRVLWKTFFNLKIWFENWKVDLVELGFTEEDENGSIRIWEDKLKDICNLYRTCISFDRSNGNRGGRPASVFWSSITASTKINE